ncbi:hypothetical protein RCC89_18600 [Cytophagaceae bacterium ABcell3]|nr:hypothetical protein RCC89_18600 [Cytophagaceae bacterium ABcell3]
MKKVLSYILLFLFCFSIFPLQWFNFCTVHPFGHEHSHEEHDYVNDGPRTHGTCEIRFIDYGYWPPMECFKIFVDTDDSQLPDNTIHFSSSAQNIVLNVLLCEILGISFEDELLDKPPDPGGGFSLKDTFLTAFSFRGPPDSHLKTQV